MPDGRAAARAVRQVFAHALVLPQPARQVERLDTGADRRIADGEPADLARREQVPLQQGRRHRQDLGDVVQAVIRLVGRQQRLRIDFQVEQVANRVAVLETVQAVVRGPAGIRMGGGFTVERVFQQCDERFERGLVRARPAGRRHRAAPQLVRHLLPGRPIGADPLDVAAVEQQPGRLQPLVVAGDAVLVEEGAGLQRRLCGSPRVQNWGEMAGHREYGDAPARRYSGQCGHPDLFINPPRATGHADANTPAPPVKRPRGA